MSSPQNEFERVMNAPAVNGGDAHPADALKRRRDDDDNVITRSKKAAPSPRSPVPFIDSSLILDMVPQSERDLLQQWVTEARAKTELDHEGNRRVSNPYERRPQEEPQGGGEKANRMRLLYRGTRDSFDCRQFHRICDGQGHTLTVALSDKGHVFGGYSTRDWKSTGKFENTLHSWLFALSPLTPPHTDTHTSPQQQQHQHQQQEDEEDEDDTDKDRDGDDGGRSSSGKTDKDKPVTWEPVQCRVLALNQFTGVCHRPDSLPTFGSGHDLFLADKGDLRDLSYCSVGHSYRLPKEQQTRSPHLAGGLRFKLQEVEVFAVRSPSEPDFRQAAAVGRPPSRTSQQMVGGGGRPSPTLPPMQFPAPVMRGPATGPSPFSSLGNTPLNLSQAAVLQQMRQGNPQLISSFLAMSQLQQQAAQQQHMQQLQQMQASSQHQQQQQQQPRARRQKRGKKGGGKKRSRGDDDEGSDAEWQEDDEDSNSD
ncbi:unnamed protein product [Vitrella brassicaformis CCMP3155]|uniref:TLDc domain-containing protein n=1 Tax=Vitrella brassicaformis (strain CCMP3155) TaxID=1169540 RepID=A0A0G4H5U4_VITBC|nr:unnamed protein product [Vitrella brassicaformis CCMP3155]|mmetsp:Transcript_17941/g.51027  ORF Transcript_17941/g.51027 Transcript_17941/m.51027 type:complete len:480 (-) Transcript_17941:363-1802(-)|eukprot:CEM39218.1 unnamed protein product [Vitrella brassicaformis CCMP3155]